MRVREVAGQGVLRSSSILRCFAIWGDRCNLFSLPRMTLTLLFSLSLVSVYVYAVTIFVFFLVSVFCVLIFVRCCVWFCESGVMA